MTQTPPISAEQVEAAARIISPNCLWSAGYVNQHVERRRNNARAKARAALTAAASIPAIRGETPFGHEYGEGPKLADMMAALDAASAQPVQEQEPVAWAPIADNGTIILSSAQDPRSELAGWEQDGWRVIPLYASPPEQEKYDAVVKAFDRLAATQNEIVHQITARAEAAEAKVERLTEALKQAQLALIGWVNVAEMLADEPNMEAHFQDIADATLDAVEDARAAIGDTP